MGNDQQGDDEALKARLSKLGHALEEKRQETDKAARAARSKDDNSTGKAMGTGFRVASELVAAILVGGFIGWQLDKWFSTSPWFMLIFLIVGVAAGLWNVYRIAARPTSGSSDEGK